MDAFQKDMLYIEVHKKHKTLKTVGRHQKVGTSVMACGSDQIPIHGPDRTRPDQTKSADLSETKCGRARIVEFGHYQAE